MAEKVVNVCVDEIRQEESEAAGDDESSGQIESFGQGDIGGAAGAGNGIDDKETAEGDKI